MINPMWRVKFILILVIIILILSYFTTPEMDSKDPSSSEQWHSTPSIDRADKENTVAPE